VLLGAVAPAVLRIALGELGTQSVETAVRLANLPVHQLEALGIDQIAALTVTGILKIWRPRAIPGQCIIASPVTGTPDEPRLLTRSRRRASSSRSALI